MRAVQGVCINYYVAHSYVAERSYKIVNCLHLAIAVLSIELCISTSGKIQSKRNCQHAIHLYLACMSVHVASVPESVYTCYITFLPYLHVFL